MCLLMAVIFCNCKGKKCEKIIISKSYKTFFSNPMQNEICRFFYQKYENGDWIEFNDSCYKYNVGDTIMGSKK